MKNKSILYIIAVVFITTSCHQKTDNEQPAEIPENLVSLTEDQFKEGNIVLGEPGKMQFNEFIKCHGNILVEPSGTARISTLVPGLVSRINCTDGQEVRAGQVLFELTGNDFIGLQQDLAEASARLKRIKSEYERIKSLYSENVGSEKDMIMAESDYMEANARYSALKMKVNMLGLDDSRISEGDFYSSFSVKSPISGFISQVNISLGQYADQQVSLAEILDINKLGLRLFVFEKDLPLVQKNQKVSFNILGNTGKTHYARLRSIGRDVDNNSKTVMCRAEIDNPKGTGFIGNAYVEAAIITGSDSVPAVPEEAVLKSEGYSYVLEYVKNEDNTYYLKRTRVDPGRSYNGYVELLNELPLNKIITRGAYNINAE